LFHAVEQANVFLVLAQVQNLSRNSRCMRLEIAVKRGELSFLFTPVRVRDGDTFLFQVGLQITALLGHLLQLDVTRSKFLLSFFWMRWAGADSRWMR